MSQSLSYEPAMAWVSPQGDSEAAESQPGDLILADSKLEGLLSRLSSEEVRSSVQQVLVEANEKAETASIGQRHLIKNEAFRDIDTLLKQKEKEYKDHLARARTILDRTLSHRILMRWRILWAEHFPKR